MNTKVFLKYRPFATLTTHITRDRETAAETDWA